MSWSPFAPTAPLKIAKQQLYEAQRLRLEHKAAAEYHGAVYRMLCERIPRLQADIETLSNQPKKEVK